MQNLVQSIEHVLKLSLSDCHKTQSFSVLLAYRLYLSLAHQTHANSPTPTPLSRSLSLSFHRLPLSIVVSYCLSHVLLLSLSCLSRTLSNCYSRYRAFPIICLSLSLRSVLAQMAFPLHASEISDKSETGREQHISVPAELSHS